MNDISHLIYQQFPDIYKEEYPDLISFMEAYYSFLDKTVPDADTKSFDIDKTTDEFFVYFKKTFLDDFPFKAATSKEFMIKHIMDYYRTKGTPESIKLLIRLLFNEDVEIYYPSKDILKASDSLWHQPQYIEVNRSDSNLLFLNKTVTGSKSKSSAIVEGIVTKRINQKFIDVLYLSNISGYFVYGDKIVSGSIKPAIVSGSLTTIDIENGGANNKVGDIVELISFDGIGGKARISQIETAIGRINFDLVNGGSGYTLTDDTETLISDAVLNLDNSQMEFIDFEEVYQKIEKLKLLSAGDIFDDMVMGSVMTGINSDLVQVANAQILTATKENPLSPTSPVDVVLLVNEGTFTSQQSILLTTPATFSLEDTIEEESSIDLTLESLVGTPIVGDRIEQITTVEHNLNTATLEFLTSTAGYTLGETVVQRNISSEIVISGKVFEKSGNTLKIREIIKVLPEATEFLVGVNVEGISSSVTISLDSYTNTGTIQLYSDYAFGRINSIASTVFSLHRSYGSFAINTPVSIKRLISGVWTQIGTANIFGLSNHVPGARANLTTQPSSTELIVENIFGGFTASKQIRGSKSKKVSTISTISEKGAVDIYLGSPTANAVIDLIEDISPKAKILDQNTSSVGIYGNTQPFFSSSDVIDLTSLVEMSSINLSVGGLATIETIDPHIFQVSDYINLKLTIQHLSEVRVISGLYQILTSSSTTFTIQMTETDITKLEQPFTIFSSVINKTVFIPLLTSRNKMISPPRNELGNIIDLSIPVLSISSGSGANFDIGSLENEENIFLNIDLIGGTNIVGVPYTEIKLNGENSGVGFVNSIQISSVGSGYSNGDIVSFSSGGYAGGDPLVDAWGTITTDSSGGLIEIQIENHGQGYYTAPTINLPNPTASVTINMDYGYGFPKQTNGDSDSFIGDLLTYSPFTVGTISSLSNINPGINYNQNAFVRVYNKYIASFDRTDYVINISNVIGTFVVGEFISQQIPDGLGSFVFAKGLVLNETGSNITVRRTSFSVSFIDGYDIIGESSAASAEINSVSPLAGSNSMGDNAEITATVISASGVAKQLEVIDSGFGYINDGLVTLSRSGNPFVMSGRTNISKHGKGTGYWKSSSSILNSTAKLHDNDYYQEYSYEIITGVSFDKYKKPLQKLLHMSGSKVFGSYRKNSKISTVMTAKSKIEIS